MVSPVSLRSSRSWILCWWFSPGPKAIHSASHGFRCTSVGNALGERKLLAADESEVPITWAEERLTSLKVMHNVLVKSGGEEAGEEDPI